jgi:hypothetical protein
MAIRASSQEDAFELLHEGRCHASIRWRAAIGVHQSV